MTYVMLLRLVLKKLCLLFRLIPIGLPLHYLTCEAARLALEDMYGGGISECVESTSR